VLLADYTTKKSHTTFLLVADFCNIKFSQSSRF